MPNISRAVLFALCISVLCLAFGPAARSAAPAGSPVTVAEGVDDPCGTWRVLAPRRDGLSPALVVRPPNGTHQLGSAHFLVHYNGDSLATYAQDVMDAAEFTYRVLVDTLQHLPPLPDGTNGGDSRLDIYLRSYTVMGSALGTTYPETNVGAPYPNSYTSWIELVDTMGVDRRLPITAHEFYHTIQVVYDRNESTSLLEMFSTWIQDRTYDWSNIHYPTTRLFFRLPHRGLFSQVYSNVPWAIYLTEKYGDAIMKETLVDCAATSGPNPREAFGAALASLHGTTFLDEFIDFGTFNYFVGARDDGNHYSEGAEYFTTPQEHRSLCYPQQLVTSDHLPDVLGANYVLLDGDGHSGTLKLYFYPEYLASTILTITRFKGATQTRETRFYAPFSVPIDSIPFTDWAQCDSVLLVYQVEDGGSLNSLGYNANHTRAAVPAGDWVLVFDRDRCRKPFDGQYDEFRDRDGEETPFIEALRSLTSDVVVEEVLPPDLSSCRAVFVIGGYDGGGVTISDADLVRLTEFMDYGGDVYVEGARLGEYMDPSLGAGNAVQQAFWSRFSCSFTAGSPSGNLTSWATTGNAFIGPHQFTYDIGEPNAYVGKLTPSGNASYLVRDGGFNVRATAIRAAGGTSTRIMSTFLLGGSIGNYGDTREAFLNDVLSLFDVNVAALAVTRARVSVRGRDVEIEGVLEHYDERALSLVRVDADGRNDVDLLVRKVGGEWRFSARDQLTSGSARYQLLDVENNRVLWEERAAEQTPQYALRLTGIYPNPARESVRIALDSPEDGRATIGVYDVAGRLVAREPASLSRGSNVFYLQSLPVASGVYFVHISAPTGTVRGRLLVIR